ncbi:MBL fold metallo-hydrolase [Leucobacter allii]|uniref:MBL fold metallo-hydrolase n=1 Tax=Leucobacter allii TaxID=2932247 RepID=A0ABY4FLE4_9MICO|nr:MBL fold metallo-hydrolase [Leucobacter allii]UOQ57088.1 MBL fold metallo-hydrolase [Leucobacter allii]
MPLQPTSTAQFAAHRAGALPPTEEFRPGVWSLAMPMASPQLPYNLCTVIAADDGMHVIDPGVDGAAQFERLADELAALGSGIADVATITATHLHGDHLGLAARLRAASGARLLLHRAEDDALPRLARQRAAELGRDGAPAPGAGAGPAARDPDAETSRERRARWGVPPEESRSISASAAADGETAGLPRADVRLEDGDLLPIPGRRIAAIHTPGHTTGHLALRDAEGGVIYTGDHVLPAMTSGLGLGARSETNPVAEYLEGLERIAVFDADEVSPGHQFRFRGLAERCAALAEHHLRRTREVAAVLAREDDPTVWRVASQLRWSAGWDGLDGFVLGSALAQTEMHMAFVRSGLAAAHLEG